MSTINLLYATIIICLVSSCTDTKKKSGEGQVTVESDYKVVNRFSHDIAAFTQGLEYDGDLIIEGTGQYGSSWISEFDKLSMTYNKKVILGKEYFGEGLTVLGSKVYQLTYRNQKGFVYDRDSYSLIRQFDYPEPMKEGWGLTNDGTSLIASDGTSKLYFIDTIDFSINKTLSVTNGTADVLNLNELEYVDGLAYANVWQTSQIIKIDLEDGAVLKTYDLADLERTVKSIHPQADVLNGIAYNDKKGTFLITGKYWPYFYELKLKE